MAILKNTTISDTGYLQLPSGTTAQRPSVNSGQLRWNTSTGQVEYYTTAYGGKWDNLSIPFLTRTIITTGYVMGGYKDSVAWTNVNRVVAATDTTTDLGNLLDRSFNYKSGACGLYRAFTFGAGNAHATNSNVTTGFSMTTESAYTSPARSYMSVSRGHMGTIFKEHLKAWIVGGESSSIEEFDLTTETCRYLYVPNTTTIQTGIAGDAGGSSGGPWGMSHENIAIWYSSDASQQLWTHATETNVTRSGTAPGVHYQQKSLQSKLTNGYAGNDGSWSGGYTYRRTNMITNSSAAAGISKAYGNCGEENYTLGQDWQYMLGQYDGAQNNKSAKFTYSTETQVAGSSTMESKGVLGRSSAVCAWKG